MSTGNKTFIEKIGAYENDDMSQDEIITFFQELVDNGAAWKLQGHYGRVADVLIESGLVKDPSNNIGTAIKFDVETGETELFCDVVRKDLTSQNK